MNSNPESFVAAASDSYTNRSQGQVDKFTVDLDNQKCRVSGCKNDVVTSFHATAYRNLAIGGIDPDISWHSKAACNINSTPRARQERSSSQ